MAQLVPFPRCIAAQVEYLLENSTLPMQVQAAAAAHSQSCVDRFSVLVPCLLDQVTWEVVYNSHNPLLPPDVVFGPDDHDFRPLLVQYMADEPSARSVLKSWDTNDSAVLFRLLMALRTQYLNHQRRRVMAIDDPRLHFELGTMSSFEGLEMGLVTGTEGPEVIFSLPLRELNLAALMEACPALATSVPDLVVYLKVMYPVKRASPPIVELQAHVLLKRVFDTDTVKLPPWGDRMCLMEYVPKVQETLQSQVQEACTSLHLRREFMEALVSVLGRPLEAETVFFNKISFVASSGVFTFLLHVALSSLFPKVQPTLTLQSSQHFDSHGRPISRSHDDYPWSPRWDSQEMVESIRDYIVEQAVAFKQFCVEALH